MSTKINETYYGAENTWGTTSIYGNAAKYSSSSFGNLVTSGKWDIENNANLDTSIIPWGVPQCSISSMAYTLYLRKNYVSPNYYGDFAPFIHESGKKNTPIMFAGAGTTQSWYKKSYVSGDSTTDARNLQKLRIEGAVKYDSGFKYTNTCDLNTTYTAEAGRQGRPITYLDYQKTKIYFGYARFIDKKSITISPTTVTKTYTALTTDTPETGADYVCVGLNGYLAYNNTVMTNWAAVLSAQKYKAPPHLTHRYFDDIDQEFLQTNRNLCCVGYDANVPNITSGYQRYENIFDTDTKTTTFPCNNLATQFMNVSAKHQVFDDVSYHWELRIRYANGDNVMWINEGERMPGTDSNTPTTQPVPVLVIDDTTYDNYFQSVAAVMLHEFAFIGVPMVASDDDLTENIGSNKVFLPVFDTEHMITTGEYKSGSDSLSLNNATWNNIFEDNVPDWDSEYIPPEPTPEEGDKGDLSNSYINRFTNAGGLAQWVVSQTQLIRLAAFLNGSYLPTQEDLDGDFKGTNPMNYIVSVQKYPFTLPNVGNSANIYVGKINTGIQGKKLFADWGGVGVLPINSASSFDFGEIYIGHYYNDFRDYQSKILLFMPFVGTDELDPRLYIGHTLGLVYRVDYNTGAVIAEIKRDRLTMETKNSTISITVPFLAANMGAYQNQLAQLSYSKDMAKIKGVGTALSAGFTMAAGAQGTISSGQPPLAALSNLAQASTQLAANATQISQLDYQIEHTAPQVGTISTAAAATAFFMDDRARLIIVRPKMLDGYDAAEYSHTIGNACCKQATLSSFSGFTIAAAADLSGVRTKSGRRAATEEEKSAILKALQSGIYL